MTMAGALGGYYFKKATNHPIGMHKPFLLPFLIGGTLYFVGAVINIIVLKHLPYTIVFPLTSITYIWTFILSYFLLGENITIKKIVGVAFIIIGSIFLVL
jgi:drug/metabolite transporter (DMT)-like permease